MGVREAKKEQLREQIVAAAMERFSLQGYEETTVADIAAAVDVSPRTFFRYFKSKEEVVLQPAGDDLEWLVAHIATHNGPVQSSGRLLRSSLHAFARYQLERRPELPQRTRLIAQTPGLMRAAQEQVRDTAHVVADALAKRFGSAGPTASQQLAVRVMLISYGYAVTAWSMGRAEDIIGEFDTLLADLRVHLDD